MTSEPARPRPSCSRLLAEPPLWVLLGAILVDSQRQALIRANVGFSAITVPAGSHLVSGVYRPGSVAIGAGVSAVSVLLVAVLNLVLPRRLP